MARLQRISDHVLVGTSASFTTTTTVVTGDDRTSVVIDPAVELADLAALVDDLVARELTVVAGFATHPHWDHVLWDAALGPAPRYATAAAVRATAERREHIVTQVEEFAPGIDPHLVGQLTALPSGATAVPWDGPRIEVVEHRAHAAGHAALLVVGDGVFVAGDMCSDIEVPLLDLAAADPLADYRATLATFASLGGVRQVVPGHGTVGDADEFRRRLAADSAYLGALEAGGGHDDPRLTARPATDWLHRDHRDQAAALG